MADNELEKIQRELADLSTKEIELSSPEVKLWIEKAANVVRKDQLKAGEKFMIDDETDLLVKVWIN